MTSGRALPDPSGRAHRAYERAVRRGRDHSLKPHRPCSHRVVTVASIDASGSPIEWKCIGCQQLVPAPGQVTQ